jgi:hypothetical protein
MNKFNIKLYKIDIYLFSNNAGFQTKDIIAYSAASGSVIVIGIVAGLYILYCLRRRRQNPPPCNRENTNETLRSPDANPKGKYSDVNARRDCMQIPPGNHELKDHNNIDFESNDLT